ncbi:DNA topoisomerase 2-binding protein 1 [Mortierella sp. GBA35]|nr:DNA topoisomerase 2-binding protein 1 [Mortierella sp. GBA35]
MGSGNDVLIAKAPGSPKYKIAYEMDIPVVLPAWLDRVEALWQKGHPVDARKVFDEFRLGPFRDCSVCITGLDQGTREVIEKDVIQYGGQYTPDLLRKSTTHLICDYASGSKYKSAMTWGGVKCVTVQWFKDTIRKLERADESLYPPPTDEEKTEVPLRRSNRTARQDLVAKDELTLDPVTFDPPDEMYMEACQIFLCQSFSPEQVAQYKKMIRQAGGIHIPEYDQQEVTHVIVPSYKLETSTLALFNTDAELPYIVHQQWLRQSNREGRLAPESGHIVPFPTRTEDGQPKPVRMEGATTWTLDAAVTPRDKKNRTVPSTANLRSRPPLQPPTLYAPNDMRSSSKNDSTPSTPSDKSVHALSPSTSPMQTRSGLRERAHSGMLTQALGDLSMVASTPFLFSQDASLATRAAELQLEESDDDKVKEEPVLQIFAGLYITTRGCNEALKSMVEKETAACGGEYFETDPPLVAKNKMRTIVPMSTKWDDVLEFSGVVVTSCWFERSLADERIVPCNEHFLFIPMKTFPIKGFETLCISASGLDVTEHKHIGRAIKLLGGQFHKDVQMGSTNLLIADKDSGPKYEYMRRNHRPVVKMEWLKRCIKEGQCLDYSDFYLVAPPESTSQGSDETVDQDTSVVPSQPGIPTSTPLEGLGVCVPSRVVGDLEEMRTLVRRLGAKLYNTYNSNATHLIHHGKSNAAVIRDLRSAKTDNIFVVAPSWLYKSEETGLRAPEREHPEVYGTEKMVYKDLLQTFGCQTTAPAPGPGQASQSNATQRQGKVQGPKATTTRIATGKVRATSARPRRSQSSGQVDANQTFEGTSVAKMSIRFNSDQMSSSSSNMFAGSAGHSPEYDKDEPSLLEAMEQDTQERPDLSGIWQPAAYVPPPRDPSARKRRRAPAPAEGSGANTSVVVSSLDQPDDEYYRASQDFENQGEEDVVYWDDAEGREKKRALMEALGHKNARALFAKPNDRPPKSGPVQEPGTQLCTMKQFLLSGINGEQRERCKRIIKALGGVVLEDVVPKSEDWGKKITHLLVSKNNPPKTAKLVVARANRATIVTKEYVFASEQYGAFVEEDPYRVNT